MQFITDYLGSASDILLLHIHNCFTFIKLNSERHMALQHTNSRSERVRGMLLYTSNESNEYIVNQAGRTAAPKPYTAVGERVSRLLCHPS